MRSAPRTSPDVRARGFTASCRLAATPRPGTRRPFRRDETELGLAEGRPADRVEERHRHRLGRAGRRGRQTVSCSTASTTMRFSNASIRRRARRTGQPVTRPSTATTSASTTARARRRLSPTARSSRSAPTATCTPSTRDGGKSVWDRNIRDDYKADKGFFGVACSPLVIGKSSSRERRREGSGCGRVRPRDGQGTVEGDRRRGELLVADRGRDRRQTRGRVSDALRPARLRSRATGTCATSSRSARDSTRACKARRRSCGRIRSSCRCRTQPARCSFTRRRASWKKCGRTTRRCRASTTRRYASAITFTAFTAAPMSAPRSCAASSGRPVQ